MDNPVPDYLVIGHITRDLIPGGWRFGGTVSFSALTAHKLGLRVGVLTSSHTPSDLNQVPQIQIHSLPADSDTVFENVYTSNGRVQYLRSAARLLSPPDLPEPWHKSPIIHLGPVDQEVSTHFVECCNHSLIGITPQGWLRRWDETGRVFPTRLAQAEELLGKISCVILSLEDLGGDKLQLDAYVSMAPLLVQTCGAEGCNVYFHGSKTHIPAFEAQEIDPTGAGDVFATAFFIKYHELQDPLVAAGFANCVASFVVEGQGTSTIPGREQVEERMRKGKLRKSS
ncbi:MAG: PfkB family carbohydrate kinase [Anaerolineae bacterium]